MPTPMNQSGHIDMQSESFNKASTFENVLLWNKILFLFLHVSNSFDINRVNFHLSQDRK